MPYYIAEIRLNKTRKNTRNNRKTGKQVIKCFVTLVLVLALVLTPVLIISVTVGQDQSKIIGSLEDLCGDISELPGGADGFKNPRAAEGQRKALCNKIHAVINQVEAGTYESAVNKLRNDIKNAIVRWVSDQWVEDLIEKVETIIDQILEVDKEPPVIVAVSLAPETPAYNETVAVTAEVIDVGSGVEAVIVSYFIDTIDWTNVTMEFVDGLYVGEIPAFPYDTAVYYKIYAYDGADNVATTVTDFYTVGDPYPPTISFVDHSPTSPSYNESVSVFAEATEPSNASGIDSVILSYWNGSVWTDVTMTLGDMFYTASIPPLPYGITVQYQVFARDYAGNLAASDTYSYNVTDKYLPIARIDGPPHGSYLAGKVSVIVYVYDDNFDRAELTIDDTVVAQWMKAGQYTFEWNTTISFDGVYPIELTVYDMAGNVAKTEIIVTVDNTPPLVIINAPAMESYVKGTVLVSVTGNDANFHIMELYIDGSRVQNWTEWGSQYYSWNTTNYVDGSHTIELRVYDLAGNFNSTAVTTTVDNTSPTASINTPADQSLVNGMVLTSVTGDDDNFKSMELYVDGNLTATFDESGTNEFTWDTAAYADGVYKIALRVYDKANNLATDEITVAIDNTFPLAEIRKPVEDAILIGISEIVIFGYDANLEQIELFIDGGSVKTWNASGEQTYALDTRTISDGSHEIKLAVSDKVGNVDEEAILVTIDNTLPSAIINTPEEGSYLKATVTVTVTGQDVNFDRMELYIDGTQVQNWSTPGSHNYDWDTTDYSDGIHTISLKVYDDTENTIEKTITVNVDNTPPLIGTPSWEPEEPYADEQVNVTVFVSDPSPGSGLKTVVLWFKNTTDDEWQFTEMTETNLGNWTATIPGYSAGENVTFYIESLDNVENSAETQTYGYTVVGAPLIPWALFAIVGLGAAALVATVIYLWYRRRRKKTAKNASTDLSKPGTPTAVTLYVPANVLASRKQER
ncbi:MAG: hypothetical protein JSV29_05265 [Candidatus Bathyarchaeota archaeon]|nr:MAG: hypothetical protein JSV29_05265 [Candidatus Bathyarchaeota archaeon]